MAYRLVAATPIGFAGPFPVADSTAAALGATVAFTQLKSLAEPYLRQLTERAKSKKIKIKKNEHMVPEWPSDSRMAIRIYVQFNKAKYVPL